MVVAGETVGCSEPGGNPCSGGVSGLIRMATTTNAHSEDSTAVLESTYPVALRGLRASPNLRIVPDEWVKAHPAYRAMPADRQPSGLFQGNNRTAKGYKKFSVENLAKLARELKVDGVIIVTLSYSALRAWHAGVRARRQAQGLHHGNGLGGGPERQNGLVRLHKR